LIEVSSEELQVADSIVLEGLTKIYDDALVRVTEEETKKQGN
jgi:hypothetical protein